MGLAGLALVGVTACQPTEEYKAERASRTTLPALGACSTGRLGDTTCAPTEEQIELAMGMEIPSSSKSLITRYELFTDWILTANFTAPKAEASLYTGLAGFPELKVDGPAVQAERDSEGVYRELELISQGDRVLVRASAFAA